MPKLVHLVRLAPCFALACQTAGHFATTAPPPAQVEHTLQAGARVVVLARPTPGVCRLSLYVDAGSRDAAPPQAATVAAWLAAERAGDAIEAVVYPDVTEFSRPCQPDQLERCLGELANVLALRTAAPDALLRAQARLEDQRRRALAADPDRPVDVLAATALLGDSARGFFPFGRAADDPQLTATAVEALLRDHYGPKRALLVAAGEVAAERVQAFASDAFGKQPAAAVARASRELDLGGEPEIETAIDNRASLGLALIAPEESGLRAQVGAFAERLVSSEGRDGAVTGHVFSVRGGALALLRVGGEPATALGRAARELVRLQREPPAVAVDAASGDDLASISRVEGQRFGNREEPPRPPAVSGMHFGAGLSLQGAPGSGPRTRAQDTETDEQRREQIETQFQRAVATAEPRTSGEIGDYGASVATDNAARIDVQYAHGPYVAVAVRIALGADQDPIELHGRSALLATLTATACAGFGPDRLRAELTQLGAVLEPRVSAESYGLALRAPRSHWQAALDLAIRCARNPSRDAAHFAAAAARLQARLSSDGGELVQRARLATRIAPRAPGMLAPWGDPHRVGNLTARAIAEAFRSGELGARWSVALVGTVPVADATARIARRVSDLPAGALPKSVQAGQPDPALFANPDLPAADAVTLLASWDARGEFAHRLGATVFASALHAVLALTPGVEVQWQDAEVYPAGAYAALRLRVSAELVPRLAADLRARAAALDEASLAEALARGVSLARSAQSSAEAEALVRAEVLARGRLGVNLSGPDLDGARVLVSVLRKTPVRLSRSP